MMAHRSIAMRERIGRFERDRVLKKYQRPGPLLRHTGIDITLGLQHEMIGIETVRAPAPEALDLGLPHPRRNGAHRCQRDLVLKRKDVFGRQRWRSTGWMNLQRVPQVAYLMTGRRSH